ncbi:MAG: DUF1961 family protein [Pseudomonadales bacterium]
MKKSLSLLMVLLISSLLISIKASSLIASDNSAVNDLLKPMAIKRIYQNDFADFDANHWVLEGPGNYRASDSHSSLYVESLVWREMAEVWEKNERKPLPPETLYYGTAGKVIAKKHPEQLPKILNKNGNVEGGHLVLWNKQVKLPESYMISYNFEPKTPIGLGILFFSAEGIAEQDIFSAELNKRTGIFSEYTKGDINSYHISYWANNAAVGKRASCNLRKNPGFYSLASGVDPSVEKLDYSQKEMTLEKHRIELIKIKNRIVFFINGIQVFDYVDQGINDTLDAQGLPTGKTIDTGLYHQGGRFGFRQMLSLAAEYSDLKIFSLAEK